MKKSRILLFIFILLFSTCFTSFANDTSEISNHVEYLADGSYYIIRLTSNDTPARTSTRTASKDISYYSSSKILLWRFTVTGTFTYNGVVSSCNNATNSISVSNSNWSVVSRSSYPSGSSAVGNITMHQTGGSNISRTVTLTCSPNGTLK